MRNSITKISFGDSVKKWSYDQFIAHFQPIYPEADLDQYAAELGIKKPVAIVSDKPEGGRKKSALSKKEKSDKNKPGDQKDTADQCPGAGKGEHEADEEGLRRMAARAAERGEEENRREDKT